MDHIGWQKETTRGTASTSRHIPRWADGTREDAGCWALLRRLVIHGASLVVVLAAMLALLALALWWAWDAAVVPLFHAPRMTYWEALGVAVLLTVVSEVFMRTRAGDRRG